MDGKLVHTHRTNTRKFLYKDNGNLLRTEMADAFPKSWNCSSLKTENNKIATAQYDSE